ncbi:Uncharacterized protein TCM_023455, partial [Theobroma cacao]
YDVCITQLLRYAPHLVLIEQNRIKRFIRGLIEPLFRVLATQMFSSYATMVVVVKMTETRRMDKRRVEEFSYKANRVVDILADFEFHIYMLLKSQGEHSYVQASKK